MRIISGTHKGRRLMAPKKLPVRPTTDFAKEALFNILRVRYSFEELNVLDLFAGTGNISYEFASRGVPHITSVDAHLGCVRYINKIAEKLDFPISTVKAPVNKYLESASGKYDIIFADPPYDFDLSEIRSILNLIFEKNILNQNGLLVMEHAKLIDLSEESHFFEARKYGGNVFSLFSINQDA